MTADELLRDMRSALESERAGIRKLDAEAVTQAAATKEKLLQGLLEAPQSERPALVAALKELKVELRQNLILLAHARDCLREAVAICKPANRPRLDAKI